MAETQRLEGEALPQPDAGCSDSAADLGEPIFLFHG